MNDKKIFIDYLRAVADQRRIMHPWVNDKHFKKNGGNILYAVDSNIIKLYTTPEEKAVPYKSRLHGYTEIFPNDSKKLSIAIGYALAEFIFHKLTENELPLFVLPPIDDEIRLIYSGVAQAAGREQEGANVELAEIVKKISELEKITDEKDLFPKLKEIAPHAMHILSGTGYTAEFRRFNKLLRKNCIASPEIVLNQGKVTDEIIQNALAPANDIASWLFIYDIEESWRQILFEKKPQHNSVVVERDVKALARLEWINSQLDSNLYRLVYITGDNNLIKAASMRIKNGDEMSFAEKFIRHPRSFLSEHNILSMPKTTINNENGGHFVDSLDTFLAKFHIGDKNDLSGLNSLLSKGDKDLEDVIDHVLKAHPDFITKFQQSWEEYTKNIITTYRSLIPPEDEISVELSLVREDFNKLLDRVQHRIDEELSNSWNDFFTTVTEGGFSLLYSKGQDHSPHSAPLLIFNSMKESQEFALNILFSRVITKKNSNSYIQVINDLSHDDSTSYSFYISYALLFAQMNQWHICEILTSRAINLAMEENQDNITGREAYYLRAVAVRHSARRGRDLQKALVLLSRAEEALAEDRRRRDEKLYGGEIRFEAEKVSIYLCYHLFFLFLNEDLPSSTPEFDELQKLTDNLIGRLQSGSDWEIVVLYVGRSLLTIMLLILFLRYKFENAPMLISDIRKYSQMLNDNLNVEISPIPSFLVHVVNKIGRYFSLEEKQARKTLKKEILTLLNDMSIQDHALFPYDPELYRSLKELIANSAGFNQKIQEMKQ